MFARFSLVAGGAGSSDYARDPRGFALKFYTEEGNYDIVGNNTPVFFLRDGIKFPDFIHSQKKIRKLIYLMHPQNLNSGQVCPDHHIIFRSRDSFIVSSYAWL